jgi:hypothetical protein
LSCIYWPDLGIGIHHPTYSLDLEKENHQIILSLFSLIYHYSRLLLTSLPSSLPAGFTETIGFDLLTHFPWNALEEVITLKNSLTDQSIKEKLDYLVDYATMLEALVMGPLEATLHLLQSLSLKKDSSYGAESRSDYFDVNRYRLLFPDALAAKAVSDDASKLRRVDGMNQMIQELTNVVFLFTTQKNLKNVLMDAATRCKDWNPFSRALYMREFKRSLEVSRMETPNMNVNTLAAISSVSVSSRHLDAFCLEQLGLVLCGTLNELLAEPGWTSGLI